MNRHIRKWLVAAITAITTGVLVWLPTAAQAGITFNGLDWAARRYHRSGARQRIEKRSIVNRRTRRWLIAAITAITTGILVWLPTAAQAGITFNGIDW